MVVRCSACVSYLQSSRYFRARCIEGVGSKLDGGTMSTVADTNTPGRALPPAALLKLVSAMPPEP